jgi:hypothetical protein
VKRQFCTLTTPLTGTKPVHRQIVPPDGTGAWKEIGAVVDVTTLLEESSTVRTGWTVKAEPDAPATGDLVNSSCDGAPVILKLALVAGTRVPLGVALDASRVTVPYVLPSQPVKSKVPLVTVELQFDRASPAGPVLIERDTGLVALVTTFP